MQKNKIIIPYAKEILSLEKHLILEIKSSGEKGISRNHLIRKSQRFKNKDIVDKLNCLISENIINAQKIGKKITFYII